MWVKRCIECGRLTWRKVICRPCARMAERRIADIRRLVTAHLLEVNKLKTCNQRLIQAVAALDRQRRALLAQISCRN